MCSVTPPAAAGGRGGDRAAVLADLVRVCTDLGLRFAAPPAALLEPDDPDVALGGVLDGLERIVSLRTVDYATFWAAVAVRAAEDTDASRLLPLLPYPRMAAPRGLRDLGRGRSAGLPGEGGAVGAGDGAADEAYLRPVVSDRALSSVPPV